MRWTSSQGQTKLRPWQEENIWRNSSSICCNHSALLYLNMKLKWCMTLPSPSFPACSAAPPCRILVRTFSPSGGACPAAALPIPPALLPMPTGAALEPSDKTKMIYHDMQHFTGLSSGWCQLGVDVAWTKTHRFRLTVVLLFWKLEGLLGFLLKVLFQWLKLKVLWPFLPVDIQMLTRRGSTF